MNIPSESDWRSEPWGLDLSFAYESFSGKPLEDAAQLFGGNALQYQEDLCVMPVLCFRYYVRAYTRFLNSDSSRGHSDGASAFFHLVELRRNDIRAAGPALIAEIAATLRRLRRGQQWYDASKEIYGSFRRKADSSLKSIGAEQGAAPDA